MRSDRSHRRGAVLLEAIVSLVIMATVGTTIVAFATQTVQTLRATHETEQDVLRASAFLDAVALWPREDLDRHLGAHRQGEWTLEIQRPRRTLYTARLSDSTGARPLLETTLYRAEADSARS